MTLSPWLLPALLVAAPSAAEACVTRYSFDFASPGSLHYRGDKNVHYVIGKVVDLQPPNEARNRPRQAKVVIEVLSDYSYGKVGKRLEVDARLGPCGNWLNVGQVAKFGIYEDGGKPGLMATEWGF